MHYVSKICNIIVKSRIKTRIFTVMVAILYIRYNKLLLNKQFVKTAIIWLM